VFTQDVDRAYAVARRIRTGNFGHNGRVIDYTIPYGGFKQSGVGREGGIEGLHSFTELKAIFVTEPPSHLR
jgi:acyl-CoA reductase-like NAD-dependent aldehyde dehydrogenase